MTLGDAAQVVAAHSAQTPRSVGSPLPIEKEQNRALERITM